MNEFLDFVKKLMKANPELTEELMTNNIENYLTTLENEAVKPELTDNGKKVLAFLQKNMLNKSFKCVDVANNMGVTSRRLNGVLRKLVSDGFCNKIGKDPIIYELTEKGKNFIITNEE
jgi:predicted transcriptional regulator